MKIVELAKKIAENKNYPSSISNRNVARENKKI
jgi:hypothetical protein